MCADAGDRLLGHTLLHPIAQPSHCDHAFKGLPAEGQLKTLCSLTPVSGRSVVVVPSNVATTQSTSAVHMLNGLVLQFTAAAELSNAYLYPVRSLNGMQPVLELRRYLHIPLEEASDPELWMEIHHGGSENAMDDNEDREKNAGSGESGWELQWVNMISMKSYILQTNAVVSQPDLTVQLRENTFHLKVTNCNPVSTFEISRPWAWDFCRSLRETLVCCVSLLVYVKVTI